MPNWEVFFDDAFSDEYRRLPQDVQDALLVGVGLIELNGPDLGRPHADTLKGSKHSNMKELRFRAGRGVWRVAYAFDPSRKAILLVAGDKSGVVQRRFYAALIAKADRRYDLHLSKLEK